MYDIVPCLTLLSIGSVAIRRGLNPAAKTNVEVVFRRRLGRRTRVDTFSSSYSTYIRDDKKVFQVHLKSFKFKQSRKTYCRP